MATADAKILKSSLKRKINILSNKGGDPAFHEKILYEGYGIALKFYESVKGDLEEFRSIVGNTDKDYKEISEAIAYLGSGILRGATARTRTLIAAGDFSRNKHLFESEKHKVTKCYQLIRVFSEMGMEDDAVIATVKEVRNIIYNLHTKLNRKSGCYIATVVYGNPNAEEVIEFKKYRDEVLEKSYLGKIIIYLYYHVSPVIGRYLQGKRVFNKLINSTLRS